MPAPRRHLLALFALLVAAATLAAQEREAAPHFRARTLDGQQFNNQSVKGKVVLLEFWTTWCPYCRQEQLLIDQVTHEFADKGLIVLAVDVGESKKTVKKYLQESPRACPIVLTEDTNLAAMYEAKSYPIYVVIDREGDIAGIQRGAAGEDALRDLLHRGGMGEGAAVSE
jgi:thiol-disulfide isomerase/thioredoxin